MISWMGWIIYGKPISHVRKKLKKECNILETLLFEIISILEGQNLSTSLKKKIDKFNWINKQLVKHTFK